MLALEAFIVLNESSHLNDAVHEEVERLLRDARIWNLSNLGWLNAHDAALKRVIPVVLALSILLCAEKPADAGGMGRFLGSLVARGLVREGIAAGRSQSQSYALKVYTPDILTVEQLANCIKKATKLDGDSELLKVIQAPLASSQSEIDLSSTAIEFQRPRVDQYSQKSVDAFNALIARYKILAASRKAKEDSFNALVVAHNAEIDAYNAGCVKKYYADDLPGAQTLAAQP